MANKIPYEELEYKYNLLEKAVKAELDAWNNYYKGNKTKSLLAIARSCQQRVKDIVNPKPKQVSQAKIDWLGQ